MHTILVTGAAGFIGAATCNRLLADGKQVIGLDNLNDYYDIRLKHARLGLLQQQPGFAFHQLDIADNEALQKLVAQVKPQGIVHLAAQAGVRYSLENPHAYVQSNLVGQVNMLEATRGLGEQCKHFVYASSSSVYGGNTKTPFSETDDVSRPVSLYAATKRADELVTHTYSHLYGISATGLRFFTVYGPWGRPDMAPMLFAEAMLQGKPIKVFNHGDMQRDFTYIEDIVEGVVRVLEVPPQAEKYDGVPHTVFNIGNNQPEKLLDFIEYMEQALGVQAQKEFLPMQPGDVYQTYADTTKLEAAVGYKPQTPLREGVAQFARWYLAWRQQRDAA